MSISLQTCWNQTQISVNNLMAPLTFQQKLIVLIAAAAFAAVAFGFLVYTCLRRCFKKVEKPSIQNQPLVKDNQDGEKEKVSASQTPHKQTSDQEQPKEILPSKVGHVVIKKSSLPIESKPASDQEQLKEGVPNKNSPSKKRLTIEERLEKNRKFALEQQLKESERFIVRNIEKKFKLIEGEFPLNFQLYIRNCTTKQDREIVGFDDLRNGKSVGRAICIGSRPTWEDATLAKLGSLTILNQEYPFELYAVFDGHGGRQAAVFMQKNLLEYLKKAIGKRCQKGLTDEGIYFALKECCVNLDADFNEERVGTTATFALLFEKRLWVANVGDSRAIIVKDGKAIQASEDAHINIERYKKKIIKLGGKITYHGLFLNERVNGNLNMARAIGDKVSISENPTVLEKEKGLSGRPKITCFPENSIDYLLLATDGLLANGSFIIGTTEEIGEAVHHMHLNGEKPVEMAKRLVYTAIMGNMLRSSDNVSVLIVKK